MIDGVGEAARSARARAQMDADEHATLPIQASIVEAAERLVANAEALTVKVQGGVPTSGAQGTGGDGNGAWIFSGGKLRLAGPDWSDMFATNYSGQAQSVPQTVPQPTPVESAPAPGVGKPPLRLVPPIPAEAAPVARGPSVLARVLAGFEALGGALIAIPAVILNSVAFVPSAGSKARYRFTDLPDVEFTRQTDDGLDWTIVKLDSAGKPIAGIGEATWTSDGVVEILDPANVARLLGHALPWNQTVVRTDRDGKTTGSFFSTTDPDERLIVHNGARAGLDGSSIRAMIEDHRMQKESVGSGTSAAAKEVSVPEVRRFSSFSALKRYLGSPGEGNQWHHYVEQTPGNLKRFGAEAIQSTDNVIAVPTSVHVGKGSISAYYSSVRPFTGGRTVRAWLSTQSFEAQRQFGLQALKDFGQ